MSTDTLGTAAGEADFAVGVERFAAAWYPLYDRLFDDDSTFVADVERKLAESRLSYTVELYLSLALGAGVLTGVGLWLVGIAVGYGLFGTGLVEVQALLGIPLSNEALLQAANAARVPLLVLVTGTVFGGLGFASGFGGLVALPYSRSSARRREINVLLPDAVAFMYALSIGGLNQLEILEAVAEAEDTYGEVAREFQTVVQETEYFDTDYRTAIRNQAMTTPSRELEQFLTDMLSVINSGGDMTRFFNDKKDKHMRTAKLEQERTLETLELFGEMFMTLSLFPLLLIIVLVVMKMLGNASGVMLYLTVYGLIPLVGVGFLVLIATVKQDEPGDGYLQDDGAVGDSTTGQGSAWDLGLIEQFAGRHRIFDRIKRSEGTHETIGILKEPHLFFRDHPEYTMALTVPASVVLVLGALVTGTAPTSWDALVGRPVWGTFVYVYLPAFLVLVPLAGFREWNVRSRRAVLHTLSDDLRKLASANDTGLTLLESIRTVADTSSGKLAREFDTVHTKVNYGMSVKESLQDFNNRYHIPRLARTVKLISKAQEASSQISSVLSTAAQASENQDDIEHDRRARTRMQVVIIVMTFLTLLGVMMILKTQFIDVMGSLAQQADGGSGSGSGSSSFVSGIDSNLLSLLFFHAVTMQAVVSGLICGYIRDADLLSGMKYVVALLTVALGGWMVVA